LIPTTSPWYSKTLNVSNRQMEITAPLIQVLKMTMLRTLAARNQMEDGRLEQISSILIKKHLMVLSTSTRSTGPKTVLLMEIPKMSDGL